MGVRVRPVEPDDIEALGAIERAAGRLFAGIGMPDVAAHEPLPAAELAAYQDDGRAWVAVDEHDAPVGYVLVDTVDGCAHVEQISVHPDVGRQGIGRLLLDAVATWATDHDDGEGDVGLTLVTFRDVAWNRPYYERLGFRVLADAEVGPELRARRQEEAARGLVPAQRVCMRRDL